MKTPLRYQITEYDCGPSSLLNGLSYLFEREELAPEIVRNIMIYSLDAYGADGISGKSGTSHAAMMFLSQWLNGFGKTGRLDIHSEYLAGQSVNLGPDSRLRDALARNGAVVYDLVLLQRSMRNFPASPAQSRKPSFVVFFFSTRVSYFLYAR